MSHNLINDNTSTNTNTDPNVAIAANHQQRLMMDLQFLDCLADPFYLPTLVIPPQPQQQPLLKQPEFLNYLQYLTYFKSPQYVYLVKFPHSLYVLDQLLTVEFREQLLDGSIGEQKLLQMSEQLRFTTMFQATNDVEGVIQQQQQQKK